MVAQGPASTREKSATVIPCRGAWGGGVVVTGSPLKQVANAGGSFGAPSE